MKYWLQARTYSRRTYIKKYSIQINLKMHVFNLTKDELFQWYLLCVFLKAHWQLLFWINFDKKKFHDLLIQFI